MAWMLQNVLDEQRTVKYLSLNLIILRKRKSEVKSPENAVKEEKDSEDRWKF
jgi:hypothetical protein